MLDTRAATGGRCHSFGGRFSIHLGSAYIAKVKTDQDDEAAEAEAALEERIRRNIALYGP